MPRADVPAPAAPPVIAAPLASDHPSGRLKLIAAAVGLTQFFLAISHASLVGARSDSQKIGLVVGSTVIWPLIFMGLFAIGRSFRTPRMRWQILMWAWGIFCLTHLVHLAGPGKKSRRLNPDAPTAAAQASPRPIAPEAEVPSLATDAAVVPDEPPGAPPFDFSPGSHERLIALIDGAQKERYREVVAAYARACARRPADAQLALERVRFIERFAYSEDLEIEEAGPDHEAAVEYLTSRFPRAPGTILYQLQQTGFDELEDKAATHEHETGRWNADDKAEFLLLRARAAETAGKPQAIHYARESFRLKPTVAAGMLLAERAQAANDAAECLAALTHPVFSQAEDWFKKQKLDLLLKLKERGRAAELYAELRGGETPGLQDPATATALAECGLVAEAREVFVGLGSTEWNRRRSSRARFVFELKHGTATQAEEAYRAMRADGFATDPFLRYRYELFRKAGSAGWNADDFTGLFTLGLAGLFMAGLPLALLLPVHYWSLLRERKGKTGGWPGALWGLRQAAGLFGLLLVLSLVALWLRQPEELRSMVTQMEVEPELLERPSLLTLEMLSWAVMSVALLTLIWKRRAWRLLGPGGWTAGRCVGVGLLSVVVLRLLLGIYVRIWPAAANGELVVALSQTSQLCVDLLEKHGALGLLLAIAVFVPLFEEVLFRGVLLQALGKHVPFFWANAGQALAFGLVHENYRLLPFYFAIGFLGGELTRRSGGLLPALIVHACNNAVACSVYIFVHRGGH